MGALLVQPIITLLSAHGGGAKGADTILASDPNGFIVTLISVSVVISALLILAFIIWAFSSIMVQGTRRNAMKAIKKTQIQSPDAAAPARPGEVSGEIVAAIAFAIKLHKAALHDHESEVITINKVARTYSPWSSKIHGLTQMPR
ncbi:MAG: OadG family protein [Rikenellaceae bacterium]